MLRDCEFVIDNLLYGVKFVLNKNPQLYSQLISIKLTSTSPCTILIKHIAIFVAKIANSFAESVELLYLLTI